MFNAFDLLDLTLPPFDWDKESYAFNRKEKDMKPYSIYNREDSVIIVHNILGIRKEDLTINTKVENHKTYLVIAGETTDEITEKKYSINSRFMVDDSQLNLKNTQCTVKNGLLYIEIKKKEEKKPKEFAFSIQ